MALRMQVGSRLSCCPVDCPPCAYRMKSGRTGHPPTGGPAVLLPGESTVEGGAQEGEMHAGKAADRLWRMIDSGGPMGLSNLIRDRTSGDIKR